VGGVRVWAGGWGGSAARENLIGSSATPLLNKIHHSANSLNKKVRSKTSQFL
jgi:hypothetical protein